jgi:hypothetical protein
MKATQRKFFENCMVDIGNVLTPGYESVTGEDVLRYLRAEKPYDEYMDADDILKLPPAEIADVVAKLPGSARKSLVVRASELIEAGELFDARVIKAVEEAVGFKIEFGG